MADPIVSFVEVVCVGCIKIVKGCSEVWPGSLKQKVIVIGHENIGMN